MSGYKEKTVLDIKVGLYEGVLDQSTGARHAHATILIMQAVAVIGRAFALPENEMPFTIGCVYAGASMRMHRSREAGLAAITKIMKGAQPELGTIFQHEMDEALNIKIRNATQEEYDAISRREGNAAQPT